MKLRQPGDTLPNAKANGMPRKKPLTCSDRRNGWIEMNGGGQQRTSPVVNFILQTWMAYPEQGREVVPKPAIKLFTWR